MRAPFFQATYIPVIVGGAVAWWLTKTFDVPLFVLTIVAAIALDSSTHMWNDYFDFRSGNDLKINHSNPFAGGSRVLVEGLISPVTHRRVAAGFLALGVVLGIVLVISRGLVVLAFGVIGVVSLLFYVGPPLRLAYRGLGEFFVGLNYGLLLTLGTFFVQTQRIALEPIWASLPIASQVVGILWINEFPDLEGDMAVGKRTMIVRLGYRRAIQTFEWLMILPYVLVVIGILLRIMPLFATASLLTIPLTVRSIKVLRLQHDKPNMLVPANASVVMTHLLTGLLLLAGYVAASFI